MSDAATSPALELFEHERPRLLGLAYRLLGSLADAEDVVQEAWVRWERADRAVIERPEAWLTTVTSRLGLDRLRSRQRDRTDYVGPWLPEPLVSAADDPADAAVLSDSLTTAFLLLLEQLGPVERLVLLLADVFDEPFARVAEITGRSEEACRQVAVRARRKVRAVGGEALPRSPRREQLQVAAEFAAAALSGDTERLLAVLAPDVVLLSDGGPDHHAARRPVVGPDRVARLVVNLAKRVPPQATMEPVWANGSPALLVRSAGAPAFLQAVDVRNGRVVALTLMVNPDKLLHVDRVVPIV